MGSNALPAHGLPYLYWHGTNYTTTDLAQMARDVLTDAEVQWLQERSGIIRSLACSQFSGDIPFDERAEYHRLAQKVTGFGFMVSWTCGSCVEKIGIYLQTTLEP
jgi:hypothetical protein